MLRQPELESRADLWAIRIEHIVGSDPRVAESYQHVRAPLEALCVGEIVRSRILRYRRRSSEHVASDDIIVVLLERTSEYWVEARNQCPQAEGGAHQTIRACPDTARSRRGTASTRADRSAEPAYPAARRILHDSEIRSEEVIGPGFGTEDICIGDAQVIARDSNIKIVLERQGNRIVDRKHNLPVMHELPDPRRIA